MVAEIDGTSVTITDDGVAFFLGYAESDASRSALQLRRQQLPDGRPETLALGARVPETFAVAGDGNTVIVGVAGEPGAEPTTDVFALRAPQFLLEPVMAGNGPKSGFRLGGDGAYLVFERSAGGRRGGGGGRGRAGGRGAAGGRGGGPVAQGPDIVVADLATGGIWGFEGGGLSLSRDRSTLGFSQASDGETTLVTVALDTAFLAGPAPLPRIALVTADNISAPEISPDGGRFSYQKYIENDWEIFVVPTDGSGSEYRLTREIQHDRNSTWIDATRVLAVKGEGRHSRSYLYDVEDASLLKLFHNNTVRTIAPEYGWEVGVDGNSVLIIAERDGNTVSPERGVYWVDLTRTVSRSEVGDRLRTALQAEEALERLGVELFRTMADDVRAVTEQVSTGRIYTYAQDVYRFDTKYVGTPGNLAAIDYYTELLRSWGYEPEQQWFDARGSETANVIVRIPGTLHPELVYVVSSHFDSQARSPGADDNSSGSTALLEVARVLQDHPAEATIELAWFTGEEAGLQGSREYVRLAQETGKRIVGALNNDMVGFANNHRLDNTIRYSNSGIRDVQHGAARQFTDLILYDAVYYRSTDAAAYYEAYGDIVGGIGSYPVLGSPYYHQSSDRLETINQQLVAEVAKTTAATLMLLASTPSRLVGLEASGPSVSPSLSWTAAVESNVVEYRVRYLASGGQERILTTDATSITLTDAAPGSEVDVRAVNDSGRASWDAARVTVGG